MERPENDKWLDEVLSEIIGSKETRTDFEQWKQQHPDAVEMLTSRAGHGSSATVHPLSIRRIIMKSKITRFAAAAAIIIFVGIVLSVLGQGTPTFAQVIEPARGAPSPCRQRLEARCPNSWSSPAARLTAG